MWARLPPAERRIDCDSSPASQVSCGAAPNVAMKGTAMPGVLAEKPVRVIAPYGRTRFIVPGGCVDTATKVRDGLVRPLDVEAQAMRLVSVSRTGPSHRRAWLDEVGEGNSHLDLSFPKRLKCLARPRELIEMHVSQLRLVAVFSHERMQPLLRYHRERVGDTPLGAFKARNSEPTGPHQSTVVVLRRILRHRPPTRCSRPRTSVAGRHRPSIGPSASPFESPRSHR